MITFLQLIMASLFGAAVYVLMGYGFVLTWRVARVFNLAQGASGVAGAYVCLFFIRHGFSLVLSIVIGVIAGGILGFLTERVVVNPLRFSKIVGWLLGTLALDIIIIEALGWWWGTEHKLFPPLLGFEKRISIAGVVTDSTRIMAIGVSALIIITMTTILERTMWGRAMKATAHDRVAAEAMGINTGLIVMGVFSLTSAFCVVSIMLQAPVTGLCTSMCFMLIIKGMVAAVVGGIESWRGVLLGAVLVGLLDAFGTHFFLGYRDVLTFAVLALVLILRPEGLLGKIEERVV
jgi:branched-chain amino acid transport system permease protein